jgi:ketopantoate reductase
MLVDVRAGIPLEADGMTGAVVRIGGRHGIDTPVNRYVTALLSAINTQEVN